MNENMNEGEAMPKDLIEDMEKVAEQAVEVIPEKQPVFGLRMKMGKANNPFVMQFQFKADAHPQDVANEINNFLQMKVELLGINNPDGKQYFRKSDVLPRRKGTIDILYDGAKVASSLMNVPVNPIAIFNNEGRFFRDVVTILLRQAKRNVANGTKLEVI